MHFLHLNINWTSEKAAVLSVSFYVSNDILTSKQVLSTGVWSVCVCALRVQFSSVTFWPAIDFPVCLSLHPSFILLAGIGQTEWLTFHLQPPHSALR